jgi:membrane protein implicated in regulation of membrane protease activity
MKQPTHKVFTDRVILLFITGLFLLCSPVRQFWASPQLAWYTPYVVWLFIITLTYFLYRWLNRQEP